MSYSHSEGLYKILRQIKILYAEDYDLVLFTIKQLLELEDWCVDVCRDGAVALGKLESLEPYDVIVLDADMPGLHGLELLKRSRSMPHRRRTPIIVFTASDCERDAYEAGADAFLRKPNGIRDLIQTIERLLHPQGLLLSYGDHQSSAS